MRIVRFSVYILFAFLVIGLLVQAADAASVFYAVGQNTADHKTGTPTITISSGNATFSIPQTAANMGVGDRVTYNGVSVAYISARTSATQWTLVTATGGTPPNVAAQTVNLITHEYTSLNAALAGASDVNHLNTTSLTGGNYILYLPCYYDSGPDTTQVKVPAYTTGPSNYIKIYAPNNTSTEVNQSQRHSGVWNANKYNLQISNATAITGSTPVISIPQYTIIEGLQILLTGSQSGILGIDGYAYGRVDGNIVRSLSTGTGLTGIYIQVNGNVYNNMVYDFNTALSYAITGDYLYNPAEVDSNTVNGCTNGIGFGSHGTYEYVRAMNNLVSNCVTNWPAPINPGDQWASGTDYNLSSDATIPNNGSHNRTLQKVLFVNAASKNFHLSPLDTAARGAGEDLSGSNSSLPFNVDIDGQTRSDPWDIGADQYVYVPYTPSGIQFTIGNGTQGEAVINVLP